MIQNLYFEAPTSDAFLKVLQPLWVDEAFSVYLLGQNKLADDLAAAAVQQGVLFQRGDALTTDGIENPQMKKARLLILTEQLGEMLAKQLLYCVDLENVTVVAPITDWHYSQKPLFLVSIPKAGTHLIYELAQALGYHAGVQAPEFPVGQTWYCIEYTNSHTVARDFFVDTVRRSPFGNRHHSFMHSPTLFMYRHPLDILISEAHYYDQDGKTAFAGWLDGTDFDERVARLLNDNWLIGSLRERIGGFLPWLDFPNVISLSFEELIGAAGGGCDTDQLKLIWSIQLKLQVPGDPRNIASRLFNSDSATFRSGQLGGYKKHLPERIVSDFTMQNADILAKLGYPADGSVGLPVDSETRRKREIRFSKANFENTPINIEGGFLGCNLVRYAKRIYAVPVGAGPVALEALPDDLLAAIPSAPSLNEIKAILFIGHNDLFLHHQSLDKLAQAIQGIVPIQAIDRYWIDSDKPSVVEEYNGFNLVSFQNRYFGIRQSLGVIELSQNLTSLLQSTAPDDLMISRSLDQLRDDIDGISTSKRIYRASVEAHERVMVMVGALETQLRLSQSEVLKQQQLIAELRAKWVVRIARCIKRVLRAIK